VILGFRRAVDDKCALPCYYEVSSDSFLPRFWGNLSVPY